MSFKHKLSKSSVIPHITSDTGKEIVKDVSYLFMVACDSVPFLKFDTILALALVAEVGAECVPEVPSIARIGTSLLEVPFHGHFLQRYTNWFLLHL